MIDIEKIKALLASSATGYGIELKTGISRTQIGNYRKDSDKVMKMSLENALKLQNYYEEMEKMNKRWIVSLNGKLSIVDFATKQRMDNPVRVTGPHKSDYPEPEINNIIIDEVEVTPEIIEFEKVRDEINRLAASSKQEVWYDDYNETLTAALKSVGYDR